MKSRVGVAGLRAGSKHNEKIFLLYFTSSSSLEREIVGEVDVM
jgi:hypothetical protein